MAFRDGRDPAQDRVHFHAFMRTVHEVRALAREDLLTIVAGRIAGRHRLVC